MTVNQKAAALATLEIRLDNIRRLLERETDPEWRADLIESLGELAGGVCRHQRHHIGRQALKGELTMTSAQNRAALLAIRARQQIIRELLGLNPSPELVQYTTKELEDLEGAYVAISAIETDN